MKKLLFFAILISFISVIPACNSGKKVETETTDNSNLVDSLMEAIEERDSLLSLITEISSGMSQIKEMENIINTTNLNNESPNKREEIKNDLLLIQQTLVDRKNRLEELEKKLSNSKHYSDNLKQEIEKLKEQISAQEQTILGLNEQLQAAKIEIASLNVKVDSLKTENTTVSKERDIAQQEALERTNELNTCYFVIGTKSELKKYKVIETGFLRKTRVMEGDYSMSCFSKADKRTLHELPLFSKKAQLMSNHPADSYKLEDRDGSKVLVITNQTRFWERSNYLIIKVD